MLPTSLPRTSESWISASRRFSYTTLSTGTASLPGKLSPMSSVSEQASSLCSSVTVVRFCSRSSSSTVTMCLSSAKKVTCGQPIITRPTFCYRSQYYEKRIVHTVYESLHIIFYYVICLRSPITTCIGLCYYAHIFIRAGRICLYKLIWINIFSQLV